MVIISWFYMMFADFFDRMVELIASARRESPVQGFSVQKRNRLRYQMSAVKSAMVSFNAVTNHK